MRSLRIDPDLDQKVERAAAVRGESVSEFIRHAAEERADKTLTEHPRASFADVAGSIRGGGGRARRSGMAFTSLLADDRAKT